MRKKVEIQGQQRSTEGAADASLPGNGEEEEEFKVTDRRHWSLEEGEDQDVEDAGDAGGATAGEPARPSIIDEYRQRTELAENQLQEYIEAFKQFREEQDQFRKRLTRDVDRKVDMKFGDVVGSLLETVDNLDLALGHARQSPGAESLVAGIELARDRFLATLERAGVEKIEPVGQAFDPNEAEALRVDPVESAASDGTITETLQPGYRIRECLIRPARVAVGRFQKTSS